MFHSLHNRTPITHEFLHIVSVQLSMKFIDILSSIKTHSLSTCADGINVWTYM